MTAVPEDERIVPRDKDVFDAMSDFLSNSYDEADGVDRLDLGVLTLVWAAARESIELSFRLPLVTPGIDVARAAWAAVEDARREANEIVDQELRP